MRAVSWRNAASHARVRRSSSPEDCMRRALVRSRCVGLVALRVAFSLGIATLARAQHGPAPERPTAPPTARSPYALADQWIATNVDTLRALTQRIWAHPEVGLQE